MNSDMIKEKLVNLNLTNDLLSEIEQFLTALPSTELQNRFLFLLEKTTLQHFIKEFIKQNMIEDETIKRNLA